MDDWGQTAVANVRKALAAEFAKREHLQVTEFDPSDCRALNVMCTMRPSCSTSWSLAQSFDTPFNVQQAPHQQRLSPFFPEKAFRFHLFPWEGNCRT